MEHDLLSMHAVNLGHVCYLETTPLQVIKEEVKKKSGRLQVEIGRMISDLHMQLSLFQIITATDTKHWEPVIGWQVCRHLTQPRWSSVKVQSHVPSRSLHSCCPLTPRVLSSVFSRSGVLGSCVHHLRKMLLFLSAVLCYKSSSSFLYYVINHPGLLTGLEQSTAVALDTVFKLMGRKI